MINKLIIIVSLLMILGSSFAGNPSKNNELYITSNLSKQKLHPIYTFYLINDSTLRIYFKINASGFKYIKNIGKSAWETHYKLEYKLYESKNASNYSDSASFKYTDTDSNTDNPYRIGYIDIRKPRVDPAIFEFIVTNDEGFSSSKSLLTLSINSAAFEGNFLLSKDGAIPCFQNFIRTDEGYILKSKFLGNQKVRVYYYKSDSTPSMPPYSLQSRLLSNPLPDSTFFESFINGAIQLKYFKEGIYMFQIDSSSGVDKSYLLAAFNDYPKCTNPENIIPQLIYITSSTEFSSLALAKNKINALNNFWLEIGGEAERSRALITEYYSRVEYANANYTTMQKGWQTDRGMVYIVLGAPDFIVTTSNTQIWIYGENASSSDPVNFKFVKNDKSLSNNDFILERSDKYLLFWNNAVQNWRNGIIKHY